MQDQKQPTETGWRLEKAHECVNRILSSDENWTSVIGSMHYQDAYAVMGLAFGLLAKKAANHG